MQNESPGIMGKIGIIFLTWRRYNQKLIKPYNITLKQFYVLRQLDKNDFLHPAQIADIIFADRPTTSIILKNLEKKGWIIKERDPENGKRSRIYLTVKGKEKTGSIPQNIQKNIKKGFDPYSCFTDEEKMVFDRLLTKLQNHIKEL